MISHSLYSLLQPLKLLQNCIYGNSFSFRLHVPGFVFHSCQPSRHDARISLHDTRAIRSGTKFHCMEGYSDLVCHSIDFLHLPVSSFFKFFGISANGFRIAAGFIIFKIGYDMLQAHYNHDKISDEERSAYAKDISITPLAIPMLCGPGAIANGIMLMDQANNWILLLTLVSSIAIVYLISYLILRCSTKIMPIIGETGNMS